MLYTYDSTTFYFETFPRFNARSGSRVIRLTIAGFIPETKHRCGYHRTLLSQKGMHEAQTTEAQKAKTCSQI